MRRSYPVVHCAEGGKLASESYEGGKRLLGVPNQAAAWHISCSSVSFKRFSLSTTFSESDIRALRRWCVSPLSSLTTALLRTCVTPAVFTRRLDHSTTKSSGSFPSKTSALKRRYQELVCSFLLRWKDRRSGRRVVRRDRGQPDLLGVPAGGVRSGVLSLVPDAKDASEASSPALDAASSDSSVRSKTDGMARALALLSFGGVVCSEGGLFSSNGESSEDANDSSSSSSSSSSSALDSSLNSESSPSKPQASSESLAMKESSRSYLLDSMDRIDEELSSSPFSSSGKAVVGRRSTATTACEAASPSESTLSQSFSRRSADSSLSSTMFSLRPDGRIAISSETSLEMLSTPRTSRSAIAWTSDADADVESSTSTSEIFSIISETRSFRLPDSLLSSNAMTRSTDRISTSSAACPIASPRKLSSSPRKLVSLGSCFTRIGEQSASSARRKSGPGRFSCVQEVSTGVTRASKKPSSELELLRGVSKRLVDAFSFSWSKGSPTEGNDS
eukprot:scaffold241_cov242-Pinguiococcus_pyrenoidosus.AAC.28